MTETKDLTIHQIIARLNLLNKEIDSIQKNTLGPLTQEEKSLRKEWEDLNDLALEKIRK